MDAHERRLFSKLASACDPILPDTVRLAAMAALAEHPNLCSDGLREDIHAFRSTLAAILASSSRELIALLTPLFADHRFHGEVILAKQDMITWNSAPCLEVGQLLLTVTGMQAQPLYGLLTKQNGNGPHSAVFQSVVDSVLLVDDGSWLAQDVADQLFFAKAVALSLPYWNGGEARTLLLDRARSSVSAEAWTTVLRAYSDSNSTGTLIRAATWLVCGTANALLIFHQALGISAHAAMGLVDMLPDWEDSRGKPQAWLERELTPFLNHLKTLKAAEPSL